jgi:AcrR family transcriptional regulator
MDQTDGKGGDHPSGAPPVVARRTVRTRNGLTSEQRRQHRREALIDAGLELFGTKGYNSTSVEEICRTAYVSTRNFYEEFENREALLWHIVYQTVAEAFDALRGDADSRSDSFRTGLRKRTEQMVHAFLGDPRRARLVFIECRGMSVEHEHRRRAAQKGFAHLLEQILAETGAFETVSERARGALTLGMVGAYDIVLTDWVLQDDPPPVDQLVESLIEMVGWMGSRGLRGIGAPSSP